MAMCEILTRSEKQIIFSLLDIYVEIIHEYQSHVKMKKIIAISSLLIAVSAFLVMTSGILVSPYGNECHVIGDGKGEKCRIITGWWDDLSYRAFIQDTCDDICKVTEQEPAKDNLVFNQDTIKLDELYINVQVADTEPKRIRGLMFQEQLSYNQGMLFVFDEPDIYSLWMLNMKFPLDMLWFDQDKNIIYIETDVKPCSSTENMDCPIVTPDAEASYILEVTSGFVERFGITKDSKLSWVSHDYS